VGRTIAGAPIGHAFRIHRVRRVDDGGAGYGGRKDVDRQKPVAQDRFVEKRDAQFRKSSKKFPYRPIIEKVSIFKHDGLDQRASSE
jgi:hypothetical protein